MNLTLHALDLPLILQENIVTTTFYRDPEIQMFTLSIFCHQVWSSFIPTTEKCQMPHFIFVLSLLLGI